jgi:hypothetical protein
MELAQQKEQFSNAYLQAVASVAGYTLAKPPVDDDSVDWCIFAGNEPDTPRRPRIELQLKCTAREVINENIIAFRLSRKNYDDLQNPDVLVPRILIVMLVPAQLAEWLQYSEEKLTIRYCCYWRSLCNEQPIN